MEGIELPDGFWQTLDRIASPLEVSRHVASVRASRGIRSSGHVARTLL